MKKNKEILCNEHSLCDICDYCVYYNYNGVDMIREGRILKGILYIDEGYCKHPKMKKVRRDPGDNATSCKYFKCEICRRKKK